MSNISAIIPFCLTVIGGCFLITFLAKCNKQRSVGGVFLKNITSIFFILTAAAGIFATANYIFGVLVLVGLAFGMLGDIYLDQKWVYPKDMKQYLYAGFVSFGIGHFFYIAAMIIRLNALEFNRALYLIPLGVGLIVAIGNLILEKPMKQHFGEYKIVVTVYGFILATMFGFATLGAVLTKTLSGSDFNGFAAFCAGGLLFLLSDLILSPMYFGEGKNTPVNMILNHVTYYAGQYLIALSVLLMAQ